MDVTVSSGPEQVVVPKVYGLNVLDARETLEAAGLIVDSDYVQVVSEEPFDTVLETNPEAGTTVDEGTVVSLVASAGPASATASASSSASPAPQASPAPEPEDNNAAEARQEALEEQREARQEAREEQQEAREEATREDNSGSGSNSGSRQAQRRLNTVCRRSG